MAYSVGVIIISDRAFIGQRKDKCYEVFKSNLDSRFEITFTKTVNDDPDMIKDALIDCTEQKCNLIFTSGGTGLSTRDNTPEVTKQIITKFTPGIDEAIRSFSKSISPYAIYSRAISGIKDDSLIINLPGSPNAVGEILEYLLKTIEHPLKLMQNKIEDCQKEITNDQL